MINGKVFPLRGDSTTDTVTTEDMPVKSYQEPLVDAGPGYLCGPSRQIIDRLPEFSKFQLGIKGSNPLK